MTQHTFTDEQETIFSAARDTRGNLALEALAGCGKTSTLEALDRIVKEKPVLYLSFNKKVADEAKTRMLSTTTCKTFNSLGHGIWAGASQGRLSLNTKKSGDILRTLISESPKSAQGPMWDAYYPVIDGVARAKAIGYIPDAHVMSSKSLVNRATFHDTLEEDPDDLTADLIDTVLSHSIADAFHGRIDFHDQIYMSALFGSRFPQFPLVMVDEVQDLNPINHALLARLISKNTRLIIVGDPNQNIYGFRGAAADGMAHLTASYKMETKPLSVSFRCPQAIVENVHWHVPHFKWLKPGGHVENLASLDGPSIPDGSTILCRNNAPLFTLALHLLGARRSVSISGSDIGPKLIAMMKKLGPESLSTESTLSAINDWEAERLANDSKIATEYAECMRVFARFGNSLGQALALAAHLFEQRGTIALMTGHKAKGLEFPRVYHLDPFLCRNTRQDNNVRYVISTRAIEELYTIRSENIEWPEA